MMKGLNIMSIKREGNLMKPPTIQSGEYRIRYRQIPYVGRFFFIDIIDRFGKWDKNFMKICSFHDFYDLSLQQVFGVFLKLHLFNWNIESKLYSRLTAFMNKVKDYDYYLDKQEKKE